MEKVIKKIIIRIIIILIAIMVVNVFCIESEVHANALTNFFTKAGQNLINAVLGLLMWIADLLLQIMQNMMVGEWKIESYDGYSKIQYSPGIIFMDKVPGLNVDFVGITEAKSEDKYKGIQNNNALMEEEEELLKILKNTKSEPVEIASLETTTKGRFAFYKEGNLFLNEIPGIKQISLANREVALGEVIKGANPTKIEEFNKSAGVSLKTMGVHYDEAWCNENHAILSYEVFPNNVYSRIWTIVFKDPEKNAANSAFLGDWYNVSYNYLEVVNDTWIGEWYEYKIIRTDNKIKNENYTITWESDFPSMGNGFEEKVKLSSFVGAKDENLVKNDWAPLTSTFWTSGENLYVYSTYFKNYKEDFVEIETDTKIFDFLGKDTMTIWDCSADIKLSLKQYDISDIIVWDEPIKKDDIALQLRPTIASWYKGLRTIALVGLLSVLVYIGIKIILSSSSAQDKAKYKNMLKDWVVALCLLFVLHYTMVFMTDLTGSLIEVISGNVEAKTLDGNGYDKLMSKIRNEAIANSELFTNKTSKGAGYGIMYLALVIMTATFTFQYLKRVVFMAFLTMVAPLICLTYPIDKMKSFKYWLREYIVNCLIQPVHLLLYTVLISSAFSFAEENILYAVVALAFMSPIENIIREMFGLNAQTSSGGALGGFAGGAFVSSMLNKMNAKPPKEEGKDGEDGKAPKTSNSGGGSSGSGGTGGAGGSNTQPNRLNGIKAVAKKKLGNLDTWKTRGKKFVRGGVGTALGAAAGTATLAANIADGDLFSNPSKAMGEIAGGTMAGYHAGNNLAGRGMQGISNTMETYKEGAYGKDEYAKMKANKEFYKSEEFGKWAKDLGISKDELADRTKNFTDNDIRDVETIKKCMSAGVTGEEYKAISEAGIKDPADYARVKGAIGSDPDLSGFNAKDIATGMKVAREVPAEILADEDAFRRYMASKGVSDRGKAIKYKNNIMKFI